MSRRAGEDKHCQELRKFIKRQIFRSKGLCGISEFVSRHLSRGIKNKYKEDRRYAYNVTLRRVHELFFQWKNNKYYIFCLCACVCAYVCLGACICVRACSRAYPACNSYAPYSDVICGPFVSTILFDIMS